MQKYKIDFLSYVNDDAVMSNCADITFLNTGTATVVINDTLPLLTNQQVSFTANRGEIDLTTYRFSFKGPADKSLIVFRKVYV